MAESVLRFRVETLDANAKIAHLTKKVQGLEVAVKNAGGTTRAAGAGLKALNSGAQAAAVGARGLGAALSAALGPITAVVAGAASLGQAFNSLRQQDFSEAKVKSLGVNSEELRGRLQGVSRELAGQASVLDLTAAAYDVASAGFNDAADASKILKAASQGATGGFSDINTVGDATTSVLNAYGLGADKASKLVDGFIQTQNDGKIVIGEFAANIAKVAPVAAALGVPLEEVNAAVAQITAGGQGAEVTFTSLKTAFAQVAAGKVGKEFEKFGVEISASTLKTEGLAGTLEKIKKSGADAGTVIKAFGTEAGPSILALLNDTEKFNKLLENQKNAQGAAARAAFTASDTIDGSLKRLQTAFTNIFADGAELGLLIKSTFKVAAVTVEAFGAALKLVLAPVRGLIKGVQTFFAELKPFGENINLAYELEKGFQAVMTGVDFATKAITGFFAVTGELAATTLGNVLNFATSIREGIVGIFNDLGATISSTLSNLFDNLPRPIQFIIEQASKAFNAVESFLGETVSGVVNQIKGAGKGIVEGVKELAVIGSAVQQRPSTQPAASKQIPVNQILPTGGELTNKKVELAKKTDAEKELEKQQEAAAKLVQSLTRKNKLDSLATDEARKLKELEFAKLDIAAEFPLLKQEEIEKLQNLLQENYDITEEKQKQKELDEAAKKNADMLAKKLEKQKELAKQVGQTIEQGITGAIMGAINGTKTLSQSLSGILNQLANIALQQSLGSFGLGGGSTSGLFGAIAGIFGGGGGDGDGGGDGGGVLKSALDSKALLNTDLGLPSFAEIFSGFKFANGGRPPVGKASLVGERGPELFVPDRAGTIVSNEALKNNSAPSLSKRFEAETPAFDFNFENTFDVKLPTFDLNLTDAFKIELPTFDKVFELNAPTFKVDALRPVELAAPAFDVDPFKSTQLAAPDFAFNPFKDVELAAPDLNLEPIEKIQLATPNLEVDGIKKIQLAAPAFDVDPLKDIEAAAPKLVFDRVKDIELAAPNIQVDPVKDIKLATPKFEFDSSPDFDFNPLPTPVFDHIPKFNSNLQPNLQFDSPAPRPAQTFVSDNAMSSANVTVNVDASGSSVEGNSDQASQLGKAIGIAVQQELVKQKRPGGLLAS